MLIPSTPGPPLFRRTRFHAFFKFSRWQISSIKCTSHPGGFGVSFRHPRFDTSAPKRRGCTPSVGFKGQRQLPVLVFLPRSAHELQVLLTALYRSGLHLSFPAPPIWCSAFRLRSASIASPTAPATMPSADFYAAIGLPHGSPSPYQSLARDTTQISPGKSDRLPRTPAGSTPFALMDRGLRGSSPARPNAGCLISDSCSSGRGFVPRCLQTPPRDGRPCASLVLHVHQVEQKTFTSKLPNMPGTRRNRCAGIWGHLQGGRLKNRVKIWN